MQPPDIVITTSVFNTIKIAEPMGASIVAASLRRAGYQVEILEPSVEGLDVTRTVAKVLATGAGIVGLSVLRDKNVPDVLDFVRELRAAAPDVRIVIGGHGPSISLADIPDGAQVSDYMADRSAHHHHPEGGQCGPTCSTSAARIESTSSLSGEVSVGPGKRGLLPIAAETTACSTRSSRIDHLVSPFDGPIVDPDLVDRGKGATLERAMEADTWRASSYFDVTPDYMRILLNADAALLGEADNTLVDLVKAWVHGEDWTGIPGLARIDGEGRFRRRPLPPKIADLDALPQMARDTLDVYEAKYKRVPPASILTSRGCFYRCTFCSVVKYERLQTGLNHRQRSNENLIDEFVALHRSRGVTEFNFEDDNFIVKNKAGVAKVLDLCDRIEKLDFKISFTFFCRADVISHELFARLRDVGLTGIYFGLESVYEPDLDFFHKNLSVDQMFNALDTLHSIGFSADVEAKLRIMLGYITWHPLTSFESLRATSAFVRRYDAPPKLLRRKLRVYAGTEVIDDVRRMGLLDPDHRDGWRFQRQQLQGLDDVVNSVFQYVNKIRDRVRTLEKAIDSHSYSLAVERDALRSIRKDMDLFLYDAFDVIVDAASSLPDASRPELQEIRNNLISEFEEFLRDRDVQRAVSANLALAGLDPQSVDLFRK